MSRAEAFTLLGQTGSLKALPFLEAFIKSRAPRGIEIPKASDIPMDGFGHGVLVINAINSRDKIIEDNKQ